MRSSPVTLLTVVLLSVSGNAALAQSTPSLAEVQNVSFAALADSLGGRGSVFARTGRMVDWINSNFTWGATDYQKPTPAQIFARRFGNCAEINTVLRSMLDGAHITSRWIHEINVQPEQTPRRQESAAQMVKDRGLAYSVFGLQHNDHVWLEVFDESSNTWFPADAAYGVVGMPEWLAMRLSMENRPKPRIAGVVPIAHDMLMPFVVAAGAKREGPYDIDRSTTYLVDGFDGLYGHRLHELPLWNDYVARVRDLSSHGIVALAGNEDLHKKTADIGAFKATYDSLSAQAVSHGLKHADALREK